MFGRSFKADLRFLSHQNTVSIRQSLPGRIPNIRPASSTPVRGPNLLLNGSLAAGVLAAAGAAYYYETSGSATTTDANPAGGETFEIALGSGRRRETHTFTRLSNSACETKLHEHEISHTVGRPGNPVVKWDRNWLGSNEPCEDRSAVDLIPRSRSAREMANTGWGSWLFGSSAGASPILVGERGEGKNDLVLFSIIDGHGGWATSELLSKVLHPTLTLNLAALQAGIVPGDEGWMGKIRKLNPLSWSGGPVWTQENVMRAISSAYTQLDDNIVQTPVKLISTLSSRPSPGQPSPRQTIAALAVPADNGACSISAVVDAEAGDLYVALAGDCRAVAGWEKDGVWRCDVLSEDQMGENNREVDRMRKEHPGEEDTVIMRGRVHGGLQPTRAFGDASYKWTQGQAAVICDALQAEGKKARRPRPHNKTPPYVTARPEITHRKIQGQDGEKLRFVVLATDGLWDRITSEESTLLLASYLSHRTHPEIHKSTLPQQFPLRSSIYSASATAPPFSTPCYASTPSDLPAQNPSTATKASDHPYPAEDLPGSASRSNGTWVFEGDENAATHLIRNSLGGGDRKGRNELLSLTGGVTRWLRDDITVTVVFFDDSPKQT